MPMIQRNQPLRAPVEYARLITGPEAVKQMNAAQQLQDRRDGWPYPWIYPPANAKPRTPSNSILCPAINTLTEVLEFTVPTGFQFAFCGLIQIFSGVGYIPGDQDILWVIDVDAPIGVASVEGFPLPDLDNLALPLGGFVGTPAIGGAAAPWMFPKPHILKPNQVLRSKVFLPTLNPLTGAPNGISPGTPNFFISAFAGFTWPA